MSKAGKERRIRLTAVTKIEPYRGTNKMPPKKKRKKS